MVVDWNIAAQQLMIALSAFPVGVQLVPGGMDVFEILHRARGFLIAPERLFPQFPLQELPSLAFFQFFLFLRFQL